MGSRRIMGNLGVLKGRAKNYNWGLIRVHSPVLEKWAVATPAQQDFRIAIV